MAVSRTHTSRFRLKTNPPTILNPELDSLGPRNRLPSCGPAGTKWSSEDDDAKDEMLDAFENACGAFRLAFRPVGPDWWEEAYPEALSDMPVEDDDEYPE